MEIKTLRVGNLATNCYLVYGSEDKKCVIIDPGDDAEYIIDSVNKLDLTPTLLIATHGHFDHILAAFALKSAFNIPFMMHKKDEFLLSRMQSSAKHFLGIDTDPPPEIDRYAGPKDTIIVGKNKLKIIETPGHTPGGITMINAGKEAFVGDLIFEQGGVGRTDFAYSNHDDLITSVNKVLKLPEECLVYSGHGEAFSLSQYDEFRNLISKG